MVLVISIALGLLQDSCLRGVCFSFCRDWVPAGCAAKLWDTVDKYLMERGALHVRLEDASV